MVGDEAAIAILGEEAFYGGHKEVRESRQLAIPELHRTHPQTDLRTHPRTQYLSESDTQTQEFMDGQQKCEQVAW